MNTMDLSMGETVVLAMALRILLQQEMSPRDREIAMLLECKLRLLYPSAFGSLLKVTASPGHCCCSA